jgi:glycosyltransferase involved in cell wall biosynthesis
LTVLTFASSSPLPRRVLFLQCTNAGLYPPIIHVAQLMAHRGWLADVLSSPDSGTASVQMLARPGLCHHTTRVRPQNAVRPHEYVEFSARAVMLACRLRPNVVYASDPWACGPGLLSARLSGAALVYHEHDTPSAGILRRSIARLRSAAIKRASIVILPNSDRGHVVCGEVAQTGSKLRIVWNVPQIGEVPPRVVKDATILRLYFHGSITPDRLPVAVIDAIRRFRGRVKLSVVGYEVPGAPGYVEHLLALGRDSGNALVDYLGQIPTREELLRTAANADVGLSFMPKVSNDVNMRHMVGASNKPFDYMAAGLALLVTDLPDWKAAYCATGFGRSCDPSDTESIARELSWFLDHPAELRSMGERGRKKIQEEWNYDTAFAGVLDELDGL